MDVLKVILASLFSAAALFLIAKVIGHKQVAQLEFFDYITGITIGSIAAELATTLDDPWWKPTISMFVFGAVTVALSFTTRKIQRTRKYINGSPTIILNKGKLYRENMKKAKLELSEFLLLCRQEGYFNLNDIQTAVFEYNGRLGLNVEWLKKEMANQGYKHAKDIFLGICYDNNQLTLFPLKN